ncbi:MAG: hypothetical protein JW925_06650 [Syntrophaceae bacterium]|nr:hypothetical protein [Syntrophaceae bacterium]
MVSTLINIREQCEPSGLIKGQQVIGNILTHLRLWLVRSRPPPKMRTTITLAESKASDSCADPEYSWDDYIYPEGHTQS